MRERSMLPLQDLKSRLILLVLAAVTVPAFGQSPADGNRDAASPSSSSQDLAAAIQELRAQVQELRATVTDMKSEAAEYRAQSAELRKELEKMRANAAAPTQGAESPSAEANSATAVSQKLASLNETTQLLQSEIRTQYQTKIESASKYRLRLSGLLLLNLFSNRGYVDNLDFPSYAAGSNFYGTSQSFGATLRQSEIGLEVFGPEFAGAKTSGEIQFDFGGGFPTGALDGVNTGLVRLRTASMRLDWSHTSIVAGQDSLFISPQSPTSFASLVVPSLGYSGNLWAWTPQLRIEHKFDLSDGQSLIVQGGILDNLTGEPGYGSHRQLQAGESSGLPAYAVRTAWNGNLNGRPLILGASAYYSRQNWGFDWNVDGWAAAADWRIPLASRVELSGEFYRGRAVGGIGGGIGQSVLFSGNPADPTTDFRALNSAGGWSQLKFLANPKLEFNGAIGIDNPFSADIHAFASPVGYYPTVLAANRSAMANFIYRPRSDLLFSGEYRHLKTSEILGINNADQVNLMMGVLF
jgi:regulator of replication initiation timing